MWWICGGFMGAVVVAWLYSACVAAGRSDDEMEAARKREATKHAVDVAWWRMMADAARANARDGECAA